MNGVLLDNIVQYSREDRVDENKVQNEFLISNNGGNVTGVSWYLASYWRNIYANRHLKLEKYLKNESIGNKMAFWLLKTEPSTYSFQDLTRDGQTVWDGVTNSLALKHLRSMKQGDLLYIYHTGSEKAVIGIAEVVSAPFQDPKQNDEKLVVVKIRAQRQLKTPVTLAEIKSRKEFASFGLVRMSRLSVVPVPADLWGIILKLSNRS